MIYNRIEKMLHLLTFKWSAQQRWVDAEKGIFLYLFVPLRDTLSGNSAYRNSDVDFIVHTTIFFQSLFAGLHCETRIIFLFHGVLQRKFAFKIRFYSTAKFAKSQNTV